MSRTSGAGDAGMSARKTTTDTLTRRRWLGTAAATCVSTPAILRGGGTDAKVRVAVMGLGGRGTSLATRFHTTPQTEVVAVADVDLERAGRAAESLGRLPVGKTPTVLADFRRFLDDRTIDVVVVATCNHWHAPAAILACQAGKHVYVEKPCSHNPWEGEMMVAAARKHDRRVQMGNQRRSWSGIRKAMAELQEGVIGRPYLAQAFYSNQRPSLGRGKDGPLPPKLDWDLWQGPAPRKPFRTNYLHYNWHWFWHWGNGELGNNGVHTIDLCRWGLGVDFPEAVTSAGGRYAFQDDQETPDTHVVSFQFPDRRLITWEGHSCNRLGEQDFISFYGEKGGLRLGDGGAFTLFDAAGKPLREAPGTRGDREHLLDFLAAIRSGRHEGLAAGIDTAWPSTLLCHLGNIAHRTGRALRCDPADGRPLGDAEAVAFWSRDYEPGWELPG